MNGYRPKDHALFSFLLAAICSLFLVGGCGVGGGGESPAPGDTTAPTISFSPPSETLTSSGPVFYTVTYGGADTITLSTSDVSSYATGTAAASIAISGSGSVRTITLDSISGDGTLRVKIAVGTASDNAGNTATEATSELFTVGNSGSTPNWTQETGLSTSPPARRHPGMAQASSSSIILFGGTTNSQTDFDDTWTWDSYNWTQIVPVTSPPSRSRHAMVYDNATGKVVLFGGFDSGAVVDHDWDDTWLWNGTTWSKIYTLPHPVDRWWHAMAYDIDHQETLLFGGTDDATTPSYFSDTWTFDGTNWLLESPPTSPSGRYRHAIAYDGYNSRVVLFGGYDGTSYLGDTWLWDGGSWELKNPSNKPTARFGHSMVYDATRARVVLFGGWNGTSNLADTWEWDGTNWIQITTATSPVARDGHGMEYLYSANETVIFGGWDVNSTNLGDTWRYGQ